MFRSDLPIGSPRSPSRRISHRARSATSAATSLPRPRSVGTALRLATTAALWLATTLATGPTAAQERAEQLVEGIAAQVGSQIILASEVLELSGPIEQRMRDAGVPTNEILGVRREALERLIEGRLLTSVVDRLELGADREEVDAAIAAIAQENGLTIEQLISSIETHGLSVEEYRDKIRGEIERGKVVNAMVRSRVSISEEEVLALYQERYGDQKSGGEEIHLRHILVMTEGPKERSNSEACAIAREARSEIASGQAPFPIVAKRVSDLNPDRGGDLGWMHRSDLAAWMAKTIGEMKPGEVSPVVEMPFGCNVLELVDRREFSRIEYEDAKPELQNALYQKKTEEGYSEWLDILRQQTYIERKGDFGG